MKMLVVMVAAAASAAFAAQAQTVTFAVGDGQFAVPVVVTIVIVSFLGRLFNPAIVITIVVGLRSRNWWTLAIVAVVMSLLTEMALVVAIDPMGRPAYRDLAPTFVLLGAVAHLGAGFAARGTAMMIRKRRGLRWSRRGQSS